MAIFVTSPPAYQTSLPGTVATVVFSGTGVTVGGTNYTFPAGGSLGTGLQVQNAGTATVYVGGGSTVTTATGVPVPPGQSLVIQGNSPSGTGATFNLWGITAAVPVPVEAGLVTVDAVV